MVAANNLLLKVGVTYYLYESLVLNAVGTQKGIEALHGVWLRANAFSFFSDQDILQSAHF